MRKRLTAKLFKRLALAAMVASLAGWVVSEFCGAGAATEKFFVVIAHGELRLHYLPLGRLSMTTFDPGWGSTSFFSIHFRLPTLANINLNPGRLGQDHHYVLTVPIWLLSLIALAAFLFFRRLDRRSPIAPGCCAHCGYDASRCTDNRCSECGEPLAVESAPAP